MSTTLEATPLPASAKDITDQEFGSWTVLRYVGKKKWLCRCDCGNERTVLGASLRSGVSTSCGCTRMDLMKQAKQTHGMSGTTVYKRWSQMIQRCHNPNSLSYDNYGGRGIVVCDRWRISFTDFLADMGQPPSPHHEIDRKENDGNYEPENCRWATTGEQARNKRSNIVVEVEGERMVLIDACQRLGISYDAVCSRLHDGWPMQKALTTPVNIKFRNKTRGNING